MWLPIQKLSSYSLFQAFKGTCHISFLNQTKGYAAAQKFLYISHLTKASLHLTSHKSFSTSHISQKLLYISLSMKEINQTINRKQNNVN